MGTIRNAVHGRVTVVRVAAGPQDRCSHVGARAVPKCLSKQLWPHPRAGADERISSAAEATGNALG